MFFELIKGNEYKDTINFETAKTIARWIKEHYPNVSLYIVGSVLKPDMIHPGSDIDFVIHEVDEIAYEELIKKIRQYFPGINVDIRRMEELDVYTQQKHQRRGYKVL